MFFLNGLSNIFLQKLVVVFFILTIGSVTYIFIQKNSSFSNENEKLREEIKELKVKNSELEQELKDKKNFLQDKQIDIVPQKGKTAEELREELFK